MRGEDETELCRRRAQPGGHIDGAAQDFPVARRPRPIGGIGGAPVAGKGGELRAGRRITELAERSR